MVETFRPASLTEALKHRASTGAVPFAGGTDLMVRYRAKNGMPPAIPGPVMYVDALPELRGIRISGDFLEIGASVPLSIIADDPGERAACTRADSTALASIPDVLRAAAADLGAPALRQRATMAGNVANASPAGDTVAALYALDADIILASTSGERILNIAKFILGPGSTALAEDEIITTIRLPAAQPDWSYWRKVGTRKANALTKVSVAAAAWFESGRIERCSLAFGAVAPTIIRTPVAEAMLRGKTAANLEGAAGSELAFMLAEASSPGIKPIDDQRSTARYRKTVALNLIGEVITSLASQLKENNS